MHPEARAFVRRALSDLPPRRSVVEIGSRDLNGHVRDLLNDDAAYTGLDLCPGPGVDVVTDAATWAPPEPVDTVLCLEVLEHAEDAAALLRAAARWLEPGGCLIITAAGEGRPPHSGVDGGPVREGEHYANVTGDQLEAWLAPFGTVGIVVDREACDIYAVARKMP